MMQAHRAADRLTRQLEPRAIAQAEHRLIEDAGHHIDVLAQIGQDLPGIFRRIVKGDELKADIRTHVVQARPQIHQHLRGRHQRSADADDAAAALHGIAGTRHRILAILDDISGVLDQRLACLCQHQAAVRAHEQLQAQALLKQVDLLDDRRRRDIQLFGGLVEAAGFSHTQKCIQLRIIHHAHLLSAVRIDHDETEDQRFCPFRRFISVSMPAAAPSTAANMPLCAVTEVSAADASSDVCAPPSADVLSSLTGCS